MPSAFVLRLPLSPAFLLFGNLSAGVLKLKSYIGKRLSLLVCPEFPVDFDRLCRQRKLGSVRCLAGKSSLEPRLALLEPLVLSLELLQLVAGDSEEVEPHFFLGVLLNACLDLLTGLFQPVFWGHLSEANRARL